MLLTFPACLLSLWGSVPARAQDHIELYFTGNVAHLSSVPTGLALVVGTYRTQYDDLTRIGFGGGATIPLLHLRAATIGLDLRGGASHGIRDYDNALFGLRGAVRLPHSRIKPWIEGGGGFLAAREANISPPASGAATTSGQYASHFAMYQGLAGADYPLRKFLDIRVLEIGVGSSFGASPNTTFFQAGSGLVLHF